MDTTPVQLRFFQLVKSMLPQHISMAEDVAALLHISTDSAYRRIRGEKPLSLEEAYALCNHYKLPLDGFLGERTGSFVFNGRLLVPEAFRFEDYLNSVCQQVQQMNNFGEKRMYYLCKDIPIFHHYHFRALAAFKHFFWMRTILQVPEFSRKKFSMADYPDAVFSTGRKALQLYNSIESIEIWNIENINSTIHQVIFYQDSEIFSGDEEAYAIYESIDQLLYHLEAQASLGYKFAAGDPSRKALAPFQMYVNEVISGDNTILAELDGTKTVYLTHNVINFMATTDEQFCNYTYSNIRNLMKKSTLISSVGERERSRFFKVLHNRIASRKQPIEREKRES